MSNNWPEKPQFGHIAGSPQAKGRIERRWETLQSRLPVWFTIQGIHTMKQANIALPRFISEFNQRFHRHPACGNEIAFAPLPAGFDLDTLLAAKYNRKTDTCGCFSFHQYTFQVDSPVPL